MMVFKHQQPVRTSTFLSFLVRRGPRESGQCALEPSGLPTHQREHLGTLSFQSCKQDHQGGDPCCKFPHGHTHAQWKVLATKSHTLWDSVYVVYFK